MSFQKSPSAPASLSAFLLSVVAATPAQLTARVAIGRWGKRCVRSVIAVAALAGTMLGAPRAQAQTAHFAGAVAPNLGSAAVATSSPVTQTVTFGIDTSGTLPALSNANVLTQGASGLDFTLGTGSTCTGAVTAGQTCTVVVSFTPLYPGQRLGAVNLKNSSGTVLATALVYGTGTGPQVTFTPGAISTAAGNGTRGYVASQDTGMTAATSAELSYPTGVAVDGAGNLYIADSFNNRIRKVTAATGDISTVAGNGTAGYAASQDTGTTAATSAELNGPNGVAVDGAGNLYIADFYNSRIRKVTAATGYISTVAGNGTGGFSGDGAAATSAELDYPSGVAVDGAGNLYIADFYNNRIRRVTAATGDISTVAGNGTRGYAASQDTGTTAATSAELYYPNGVAVDGAGNLYIADSNNHRIRKVMAATGDISTVAGNGTAGYNGDGMAATSAELDYPNGVAVDGAGNLYIADQNNSRIRKVTAATGYISTVAGNGTGGFSGDGAAATSAELDYPSGVAVDGAGNLYIADFYNNRIRKVTATAAPLSFASTAVGATSSDSPQTVIVNNIGNSLLTFANPTTGGNPSISAGFSISNSSTCPQLTSGSSAGTLPPGASCTDLISFTPVTSGSVGGGLVTTDNGLNVAGSTQSVTLSGTATADAVTVTSVSPSYGPAAGGTTVTVTGTGLNAVTRVTFGGVAATSFSPVSATTLTAVAPAGTGTVDIIVGTATDVSEPSTADQFTYIVPGSFTLPTTAVGVSSGTQTAYVTFTAAGTLGTINVLTQGAMNKDYVFVSGGSCATGAASTVGQVCTVNYSFTPSRPGQRLGAVSLTDSTGTVVLGTAFLTGTGTGPLATFPGSIAITSPGSTNGFNSPAGVAVDGSGDVFVADTYNSAVKEIVAVNGVVTSSSTVNTVGSGFYDPQGVAVDGSGDVFVADQGNSAVKEIVAVNGVVTSSSTVNTVGSGFAVPFGVAVDGSGDVFVADEGNNAVKEIVAVNGVVTSSSTVNTVGSGFYYPLGVAVDGGGDVFVADTSNSAVKEIVAVNGVVTSSSTVNTVGSGFYYPLGVAVDGGGDVFVADTYNGAVKEIVAVNGVVTSSSTVNTVGSGFSYPYGVAVDGSGHLFVADTRNSAVKEIDLTVAPSLAFATTSAGATSSDSPQSVTLQNEGNAPLTFASVATGTTNFTVNGAGTCSTGTPLPESAVCTVAASFTPMQAGPLMDTLTFTDNSLNVAGATQGVGLSGTGVAPLPVVTSVTPSNGPIAGGTTVTIAGSGFTGVTGVSFGGVAATSYIFNSDSSVTAVSPALTNTAAIVDVTVTTSNGTSATGAVDQFTYVAAASYAAPATAVGVSSGTQTAYVTFATAGTLGTINVLTQGAVNKDYALVSGGSCATGAAYTVGQVCTVEYSFTPSRPGQRLGAVSLTDSTGTVVLGTSFLTGTGTGPLATFPGSIAITSPGSTSGAFSNPHGMAVDGVGDVFVADPNNNAVYEIVAVNGVVTSSSTVNTVGSGFSGPYGVAVDGSGDVFVADTTNSAVKEIVAVNGVVTSSSTVNTVGSGFNGPYGVAVDGSGDVFVADTYNGAVKEIVAVNGVVTSSSTVNTVGSGFYYPFGVAVDGSGDVFVADFYNNAVKEIVAVNGVVTSRSPVNTVGSGFFYPGGVAVDASGDVFVADSGNNAVREIVAVNGVVTSNSTVNTVGSGFSYAYGVAVDGSGHVFVADTNNSVVKEIDLTASPSLAFAATSPGATSSDSPKSVTLQNEGNAPLTFASVATGTTNFTVNGAGTCSTGTPLPESAVCTVAASFTPMQAGPLMDTLTFTDNSLNEAGATQSVSLTGTAVAVPQTINFTTPVSPISYFAGETDALTATATSGLPVVFTVTSGPATVAGNVLTFTGTGTVSISANQPGNATYAVAPTVTASITLTAEAPTMYTAPTAAVGASSGTQTASMTFTTAGTLGAINVLTQGTTGLDFAFLNGGTCAVGATYAEGQSCTVEFTFTPTHPGARLGAVTLTSAAGALLSNSYVTGVGTGPQVVFAAGAPMALPAGTPGFYYPTATTVDAAGNVYVADSQHNVVKKILAIGGVVPANATVLTLPGSFGNPYGLAVDGSGNVYVSDKDRGLVQMIPYAGGKYGTPVTVVNGLSVPVGIAVDGLDNLYVADSGHGAVKEFAGGVSTTLLSGQSSPFGVAVDSNGNVYVANEGDSTVKEIAAVNGTVPASPTVTTLGGGFQNPFGLAVDAAGDVFVADSLNNTVKELVAVGGAIPPSNPTILQLGGGYNIPVSVAVGGNGNLFIADFFNDAVKEIDVTDAPAITFATTANDGTVTPVQSVTIFNDGNEPLTATAPGLTASTNFLLGPGGCGTSFSLAEGASCALGVAFAPLIPANGPVTGTLQVTDNNLNAANAAQTIPLNGTALALTQTITFPQPVSPISYFVGETASLAATSSSGLNVTYSVQSGPASVTNNVVTFTGTGPVVIAADQAGSNAYLPAATVTVSITLTAEAATSSAQPATSVGSISAAKVLTVTFTASGSIGSIDGLTQGAPKLDFAVATGGTCALGAAYLEGQSCTVAYTFTPTHPGQRSGAIVLLNGGGALLGTTYVSGVGTGPQVVYAPGAGSTLPSGTGYKAPAGTAVDALGNLYVADSGNNSVKKIVAAGGVIPTNATVQTLAANFTAPYGVAVDGAGNVYVTDTEYNRVQKIPYAAGVYGTPVVIATGFVLPIGIAVDGAGNVYVADSGNGAVKEISNGLVQTLVTGLNNPFGVAVDASDDVYTANQGDSTVREILAVNGAIPATPTINTLGSGFAAPFGVAVDAAGDVFVADTLNSVVKELVAVNGSVPASNPTILTLGTGYNAPVGVAVGGNGNVYVGDFYNNAVKAIDVADAPMLTFPASTAGGSQSAAQSVQIGNDGTSSLDLSSVAVPGGFLQVAGSGTSADCTASAVLAEGASCNLSLVYAPTTTATANVRSAVQLADNNLNVSGATQAISVEVLVTPLLTKTITFPAPASPVGVNGTATLTATASNGDPVSYIVISGGATINGATITYTASGTVTIAANSAATATYSPAPTVYATVTVVASVFTPTGTPVGSTSAIQTATLNVTTGGTLGSINVITQGVTGLDFTFVSGGTCAVSMVYTAGQNCTVQYTFTPAYPGQRLGGITLVSTSTALLGDAYVTGTGIGSQNTYSGATPVALPTPPNGYNNPAGTAVDAAGNVYVADSGNNVIEKLLAVNGVVTSNAAVQVIGSNFSDPYCVAVDGEGNVIVADTSYNRVQKIPFLNGSYGAPVIIATGFSLPTGVAVDGSGNVYVADSGHGTVASITPAGVMSTLASGLSRPFGVALDSVGDVFIADEGDSTVREIVAVGGVVPASPTITTLGSGFSSPFGVAVDAAGDVFVADTFNNAVKEIVASNGGVPPNPTILTLSTSFSAPLGISLMGNGNVFVGDFFNDAVKEIDRAGRPQ